MRHLTLFVAMFGLLWSQQGSARQFNVAQLPNGSRFGCANCHVSLDGFGPRNGFGREVAEHLDEFGDLLWDPNLAVLDSDGDGRTNGQELQDPNGQWQRNTSNPGVFALVSNPGDVARRLPLLSARTAAVCGGLIAALGAACLRAATGVSNSRHRTERRRPKRG
jgi:hypothetical protein